ncbi:MAG: excinuclease ABC subunit A [Deltaproteobacteria bacterium]|jgi:excinuclease ABC subunit A|nr:excinuclease ABC subunit A [Deltaproteobacteria bacterium]
MPRSQEFIEIRGAAEHNLKRVDARLPKHQFVVFTGPSGSGKSSLAFDTIYAEGQRRYVESLSAYARQFLGQMEKPRYDHIRGLSPTISIEQKAASNNPRSTVGTITEIYDYLRVLYARIGRQHCHQCGEPVEQLSAAEIVDRLRSLPKGTRFLVMARIVDNRKGEYRDLLQETIKEGFGRFRIDGEVVRDDELPKLDKKRKHTIDVVVDRLAVPEAAPGKFVSRLTDSVETALKKGNGALLCQIVGGEERLYSEALYCHDCELGFPELSPQSFSFNSPLGMCPDCNGLGTKPEMDPDLVIPHPEKTVREGAIEPWAKVIERSDSWTGSILANLAKTYKIDFDKPWNKLSKRHQNLLLYGTGEKRVAMSMKFSTGKIEFQRRFEGALNELYRRFRQTKSEGMRKYYMRYLSEAECSTCDAQRLRPESRAVLLGGVSLPEVSGRTIREAQEFVTSLELSRSERKIADEVLKEINGRLGFLMDVGLSYLTLDRPGPSLSGGESQRIRLASQIGSELTGVLYILDEPSIGLHQRDNGRLLATLGRLRDLGNTVVVVEHDQETIEAADFVVDFGPGAGVHGGEVVFAGTPSQLKRSTKSITGRYLSGRESIETPCRRRKGSGKKLRIEAAEANNLKRATVDLPLETMVAVTGVSGAGKSTLVNSVLYPAMKRIFHDSNDAVGKHKRLVGVEHLDKVIDIDQRPIGRTPRSNPATYTKVFDEIRKVFAQTQEARTYGYKPGRFSFNVKGGRCEACEGDGVRRIEMHFLADVFVPCEVCQGKRFNEATLRVRFKGLNIAEVLDLSIDEALEVFANQPRVLAGISTLAEVGLGYVKLGQPSPTLSGGEAQRIKLARELSKRATGRTLYILDEPTTGLHFDDLKKLLVVLDRLVDAGNTVVVIEHNLDVIRSADWVVDLGPEGGDGGGDVVVAGTPEEVSKCKESYTGRYLRRVL